jgi:hypothetical protein
MKKIAILLMLMAILFMYGNRDLYASRNSITRMIEINLQAQLAGTVVDNDSQSPLPGVTVTAGQFQTTTGDEGEYSMYVDEGSYDVSFEKLGYISVTVTDTFAIQGMITPVSIGLWDENYAPGFVHAEIMENDSWCAATWNIPGGPYEIVMDDGDADDYFIYLNAGNMNAVKFTPAGYPATATGGKIFVGDGSFPGPFIGTEFGIAIFDDDGPDGLPGTMLDSSGVTVNNYGWVSFDWLNATIEDGSFYLAMIQTFNSQNSAPIGIDLDNPIYFKSYNYIQGDPGWVLSPLQDFMIRAWVDGPGNTNAESRNVTNYIVARYSNFDPNGSPESGILTELATTDALYYNDSAWAGLPQGWYAYGVKALYTSGQYSDYTISNIAGHLMLCQVTVNISLSTGLDPGDVLVTLRCFTYPYGIYDTITSTDGTIEFDSVTAGPGEISAFKIGYDAYNTDIIIDCNNVYNIVLSEKKYPPTCLSVDSISLEATWCEPFRTALDEDFENPAFPPAGWQSLTAGASDWQRTDEGSSTSWAIPAWESFYACSNDEAAGPGNDGCCDYLITPGVDLRESEGYVLTFNSFYDGFNGQLAFVEYSVDGGDTWNVMNQLAPDDVWTETELDLTGFCGPEGPEQIMFAFHSDDAGAIASGWAIDDVKIQVPAPAASYLDFWVYLNDTLAGVTTETNWNFAPLMYGRTCTAGVAARYTSGLSAKDYNTFSSKYLFPPDSLTGTAPDEAAILQWYPPWEYWPPVMSPVSDGPKYSNTPEQFVPGVVSDELAFNRSTASDQVIPGGCSNRDVGDVILQWPAPSPISLCWGICDDGTNLWITDPNTSATNIYQVTYDGVNTGTIIAVSLGQSWVGDMVSDGVYLYGCLVGGPNTIVKVEIETGQTIEQITGDWTVTSQRGLGADFINEEYYIGGWNSNQIWRVDATGATISSFGFSGVSGLAWHPKGGPDQAGSLWVMINAGSDICTEVDPNNSWATIQTFIMPDDQGNSGAGAEIKRSMPDGGALWLPNPSDNTVYLVDLAEPYSPTAGGHLPENILGYNIYRDGAFIAYTPHTPPGEFVPQGYIDEGLPPGFYQYTVTAVYDLSPYGYPDETGESMEEGPAEITSCCCFDLEFVETWAMGNFEDNNWIADSANWLVNGQVGNPAPAAEFSRDPFLTDYEASLTSYPICAVGMTEGKIWLDFDLKLDAVEPTGEELLQVQIGTWEPDIWTTVAEYSNIDGSFDWTSRHADIKTQAMDRVFRVRFLAKGSNTADILGWFVDNIHIYRTCEGPINLTVTAIAGEGIYLNWEMPAGGSVDNGQAIDGYGDIIYLDGSKPFVTLSTVEHGEESRELNGFNIYRSIDGGEFVLLDYTADFPIIYPAEDLTPGTLYCYKVTAVWTSETDQCESNFSNEACELWTSITGPDTFSESINLYPNPAGDHVHITTSGDLKRITVYDATGRPVKDEITGGKHCDLTTTTLPGGIFLVKVETEAGVSAQTLIIQR